MKKIMLLILVVGIFLLTGCIKQDDMEDINIITTIYPIEYVTKRLYGEYSTVATVYPRSTNIEEYSITKKQLKDFSQNDLFIYNGESNEKDYATAMLNNNNKLKIIDAAYGLEATNADSDVWMNPANILMIAQNVKNELSNLISNPYIVQKIESNYNLLKVDVSELETEFKKTADNSKDLRIVSFDESLNFLEKYGFTVINLTEDKTNKENNIELAKSLFSKGELSYLFVHENLEDNNVINDLVNNYGAKTVDFRTMTTITEDDISTNSDYLSIMNDNIANLKEETYK